jgi:hypothetical protein
MTMMMTLVTRRLTKTMPVGCGVGVAVNGGEMLMNSSSRTRRMDGVPMADDRAEGLQLLCPRRGDDDVANELSLLMRMSTLETFEDFLPFTLLLA